MTRGVMRIIAMGLALCWSLDRYGLPLNEDIYYMERLPVVVDPLEVCLVGVEEEGEGDGEKDGNDTATTTPETEL